MNRNKKSASLRSFFLACFLLGLVFCFFNLFSEEKQGKPAKQNEYVLSHTNPVISENHEVKIPKLVSLFAAVLNKTDLNIAAISDAATPGKDFSQIKILLKHHHYNLFFASGFHEPPLAA